jgi:hypothetical protein
LGYVRHVEGSFVRYAWGSIEDDTPVDIEPLANPKQ